MRWTQEMVADGTPGLMQKFQRLRQLVDAATVDPSFRAQVLEVVRRVPERNFRGDLGAVSSAVRQLRYTRDPVGVELFTAPQRLLGQLMGTIPGVAAGDCDDFVGLGAAMLETLGYPTRFAVGGQPGGPVGDPAWNHIWLEVAGPRGWVTLDDTMKGWMNGPGWSPSGAYGALVAEQRPGYAPPMQPVPVERRALYGGCAALQDGLGKFKLKVPKVVKRVANLVALPVTAPLALATGRGPAAHYVPAPLRDVLKKISGVTLPLASSATNLIVPGAGAITSVITDQVLRDQSPPTMTPAPVPVSLPQIGPPPVSYGPGGPTGGGSSAMSFAPDPQGADAQGTVSPKKKMALSDGAVYGVLALTGLAAWFLLRRRRRR